MLAPMNNGVNHIKGHKKQKLYINLSSVQALVDSGP